MQPSPQTPGLMFQELPSGKSIPHKDLRLRHGQRPVRRGLLQDGRRHGTARQVDGMGVRVFGKRHILFTSVSFIYELNFVGSFMLF